MGSSADVTTTAGNFNIASAGLTFDNSGQVRVSVKMSGIPPPPYTATLRIINPDRQPASRTFSVTGPATVPNRLSGTIGIWDAQSQRLWKLNGVGIEGVEVWAVATAGGTRIDADWNGQDASYMFNSIPPGNYTLHARLRYRETVIGNRVTGIGGCDGLTVIKTLQFQQPVDTSGKIYLEIRFPPPLCNGSWN